MGCHFSTSRCTEVNVDTTTVHSRHKDITKWERDDYKKRMNKKFNHH